MESACCEVCSNAHLQCHSQYSVSEGTVWTGIDGNPSNACTEEPVSYTHLDVYKRQDLNRHKLANQLKAGSSFMNITSKYRSLSIQARAAAVANVVLNLSLIHISKITRDNNEEPHKGE